MLTSASQWRLKTLIKDTLIQESIDEIKEIIKMHGGEDTRIFLIASLIDEIFSRDFKLNTNVDIQKVIFHSCCYISFKVIKNHDLKNV